ncbi:MAG: TetR/AcrR family transcriptional regulator [Oscillospiraceae bacterium]|nr:TetR/AcrR family transcriptional regulator [Oscillospiraceae bacterium]
MNTSNNKRFHKTEKRILDCSLKLIEKNPDTLLSATGICEELSLNRSSFYLHYKGIQELLDAVLARLHGEFLERCRAEAGRPGGFTVSDALQFLFQFAAEQEVFYRYYVKYSENHGRGNAYLRECYDCLMPSLPPEYELTGRQLSCLREFMQAGFLAVISRWLSSGKKEPPEEIAEFFTVVFSSFDQQKT